MKIKKKLIYRKFVGNRSTITQYTVLMPKDVSASNTHDKAKFCVESVTKYNPIVTALAISKLKTIKNIFNNFSRNYCRHRIVPKKNFAPSL